MPRVRSVLNVDSDFCKASVRYDEAVPKIAHDPNQVTPGSIDEYAKSLSCQMLPKAKVVIVTKILERNPTPVGPVLLVQKPQQLSSTKNNNDSLFEYRLYAARAMLGASKTKKAPRSKSRPLPPHAMQTAEDQLVTRQSRWRLVGSM